MADDDDYVGTLYDPQDQPQPDQTDPRFTGQGMDPTFVPNPPVDNSVHDVVHGVDAMFAQQHPNFNPTANQLADAPASNENAEGSEYKPMDDMAFKALLKRKLDESHQWYGSGKLSSARIKADRYYRGEPRGDEIEGRSQVVSRDVAEAVDSAMPSLMRIFTGGDQVCHFEPFGPEDEDKAKQATDYINHIVMQENEGFMMLLTWFKDGLLKKNGIVKAWHDVRLKRTKENYQGLTQDQLTLLQQNPNLTVSNIQPYQDVINASDPMTGQPLPPQPFTCYDCIVTTTKPEKRMMIMNVPPDEFIIERRATSIYTAGFLGHRGKRTISDLLECGYDKEKVMNIPRGEDHDYTQERIERFSDEDQLPYGSDDETDPTMRKVWITEAYVKCDYDGDGIAEWRCVTLAGDAGAEGSAILDNIEVDDHAFADLTPDPEPHKFYGQSIYDKTNDIQDIKTALMRGILDSTYLSNAPRTGAVDGQVNMDDLLDSRPGGIVRLKRADALVPIQTIPVSGEALEVINYIDQVKEKRTGISTASSGLNPDILNSTATGADILNNNNQQRLELICRIFAETGIKRLYRRLFQLVCQYQDVPRVVKLRNKWVSVDPRDWKDKMDVAATVGIGLGTKQQQASLALQMLNLDKEIVQLQGGLKGPFLTPENIYNKLVKLVEAVGWKSPDPYYTNPKDFTPPPPSPPTPEQQVKMQELQSDATKAQAQSDAAKASALGTVAGKKLDFDMKQVDLLIKQVELEALKITTAAEAAERANNLTDPGEVLYSKTGDRIGDSQ